MYFKIVKMVKYLKMEAYFHQIQNIFRLLTIRKNVVLEKKKKSLYRILLGYLDF